MPYAWTQGFQTYYEEHGKGFPVVLVHGHTFNATIWDDQVGPLAERYRVIAYELRGHGRSEAPASGYWGSSYAEDLRQLLDHLGIEKAVLVGQAAGGSVVATFYFTWPERVQCLAFSGAFLGGTLANEPGGDFRDAVRDLARARGTRVAMEALWQTLPMFQGARLRPAVFERLRRMWLGFSGVPYLDRASPPPQIPINQRVGDFNVPTLFLYGDFTVKGVAEVAERARAAAPQVECHLLPNTGPTLNIEEPTLFNRYLLAFLQRTVDQARKE